MHGATDNAVAIRASKRQAPAADAKQSFWMRAKRDPSLEWNSRAGAPTRREQIILAARAALGGLSAEGAALLRAKCRAVALRAEEKLLGPGRAPQASFVVSGIVRELYECEDGRDVTRCFAQEGAVIANAFDAPIASVNLAAVTDCELLAIDWADVEALCAQSDDVALAIRNAVAASQRIVLEREFRFATMSPAIHYAHLRRHEPWIVQAAKQYQIASYLRITPEHLSRLRRKSAAPT